SATRHSSRISRVIISVRLFTHPPRSSTGTTRITRRRLSLLRGEHFKTGADSDGPALTKYGEPICILCFSDFHRGQRNDRPLTSLASPRFEMLSVFVGFPSVGCRPP